jgi:hypothetical protein
MIVQTKVQVGDCLTVMGLLKVNFVVSSVYRLLICSGTQANQGGQKGQGHVSCCWPEDCCQPVCLSQLCQIEPQSHSYAPAAKAQKALAKSAACPCWLLKYIILPY